MILKKFAKASAERLSWVIDYSQWLGDGETVSNAAFVVETVTSPALVIDNVSVDSLTHTLVTFFVSQGKTANTYYLTVTVNTSTGETKEDSIVVVVQDPP